MDIAGVKATTPIQEIGMDVPVGKLTKDLIGTKDSRKQDISVQTW